MKSLNQKPFFLAGDMLLPFPQHGFVRCEENIILNNLDTLGVCMFVCLTICMSVVVNVNYISVAAAIAIGLCWQMFLESLWKMLFQPYIVIFVWEMEGHCGRCYDHTFGVHDKCYCQLWEMEWPCEADLPYFEFWGFKHNLISYARQMVFAYIFI